MVQLQFITLVVVEEVIMVDLLVDKVGEVLVLHILLVMVVLEQLIKVAVEEVELLPLQDKVLVVQVVKE
jgi:hypothetical protein